MTALSDVQFDVNNTKASSDSLDTGLDTDVLIIGAGLAGLSTALALPKSLSITVLSKSGLEVCSSHYAQGGIAASLDQADSVKDHVADTLIAGAGLCAANNTADILSQGQSAIEWLCQQGVPFTKIPKHSDVEIDTKKGVSIDVADLHLTQEGGHGRRRVAHADDATGRHVMEALILKAQSASNITILPFHEALKLLTIEPTLNSLSATAKAYDITPAENVQCQGAQVLDHHNQRQFTIHSRAVVLASGGLGQLFQRASAPDVCVGDGIMMAWQAGCRLANLEFIQFHPTGLALDDSNFLISEALRGEGGRLYCPLTGQRFMLAVDERAELAPRDIVARAIAEQISQNGLGYVHLDVSHLPTEFIKTHFPQIYQTVLDLGIDMTTSPIPVAPTAHYSCGGVVTCTQGLSDVKGLYAAGEVAYTGLHGANRLASNSLLECVVIGRNIAQHIPHYLSDNDWTLPTLTDTRIVSLMNNFEYKHTDIDAHFEVKFTDSETIPSTLLAKITSQLKVLMSSHMGIVRNASQLQQALVQIQEWQSLFALPNSAHCDYSQHLDIITDSVDTEDLNRFRLVRQLQLATLIIQSALLRNESRGGHYRTDYPNTLSTPLVSIIEPLLTPYNDSHELEIINYLPSSVVNATQSTAYLIVDTV